MIAFFTAPLAIGLWLAWKTWSSTSWPRPVRLCLAVLCLLVSQSFNIQRLFFGSLAGPDISFGLLILLIWSFAALIFVFAGSALWDLTGLLRRGAVRALGRGQHAQETRVKSSAQADQPASPGRRLFLAATAASGLRLLVPASAAAAAAGVHAGVTAPILRPWEVSLPSLPMDLDGLRLVHMADLHVGPLWSRERAERMVAMVEQAKADLVCITGDLADGQPHWRCADNVPRGEVARVFAGLKSRLGVYACTGNHEYFSNYDAWMAIWKECGMTFLHNECVELGMGSQSTLVIGGLDDPAGRTRKAMTNAFARASAAGQNTFRLLLDHRPGAALGNARRGAQLQLSGHTHGGQCPGLDILVKRANNGFVRDWYTVRTMSMYVTSGASQWPGFALRLGIPSEIALLILRRSADGQRRTRALA